MNRHLTLALGLLTLPCTAMLCTARPCAAQNLSGGKHIHTNRNGAQLLPQPATKDAFVFAVYGDRTGGDRAGLEVLRQAVTDTNLLDPDFVMTVGDLVQGYNASEEWLQQAAEFKAIMGQLDMGWFPVAGNHDVYYRGPDRPKFHHEDNYETHFGPLWYAFEHEQSLFVVLYSDEGDRETGAKAFNKPALQTMSPEQFKWLDQTLAAHGDKKHIMVFLHHPRWLGGGYGDDWERVHERLAQAGNVSAVFAGHIHRMRYDGVRDGIEYFALATTGGHLSQEVPEAGYLHHFHVVTVRDDDVSVATVPVGAILDPRKITGDISDAIAKLNGALQPQAEALVLNEYARVDETLRFVLNNPTDRPVEVTAVGDAVAGFFFAPDHLHLTIPPNGSTAATMRVTRRLGTWDDLRTPTVALQIDYLAEGLRISLPERRWDVPLLPPSDLGARPRNGALALDGNGCVRLPNAAANLPDGPFTVEAWIRGETYAGRTGLATKTESSEYGIFVSDGRVDVSVHLDGRYVTARGPEGQLEPGRWYHVAGVFDGERVMAFVDGALVAQSPGSGSRTTNALPFFVGADVNRQGQATSHFRGLIDDFRLSQVARYSVDGFAPPVQTTADEQTVVWLPADRTFGPWVPDGSGSGNHATLVGTATVTAAPRPASAVR